MPDSIACKWTLKNLGRKWRDFKLRLWNEFNDESLTIEEMYAKVPDGVPRDQWKEFVDIKNGEAYKVKNYYIVNLCK